MSKITLLLIVLLFLTCSEGGAQPLKLDKMLTPEGMKSDFGYLKGKLEATFPALYIHQSRERVNWIFDSLQNTMNQPMPLLQFYRKIAFLVAELRCEHSYCGPGNGFGELMHKIPCFPLQLHLAGKKPVVIVNGTSDTTIHPGDELISINGKPIDSICRIIYQYLPSDGFMTSGKAEALSSMMFSINYYMFVEQANAFEVVVQTATGNRIRKKFDRDLLLNNISRLALKNPVNKRVLDADKKAKSKMKGEWKLEWLQPAVALITMRTFSADTGKFIAAVDSFFSEIKTRKAEKLIIDLSYNGGGDEYLSAYLMRYLIDKPTRFMEEEYLITDNDTLLAMSDVSEEIRKNKYEYITPLQNGKSQARISKYALELQTMQPQPNRFAGPVFLYVNGVTSSAASTFAAVAQSNKRAVVAGQETAGSFRGGGAVLGMNLKLPHSGITTHTSLVYQVFATSGRDGNRGVIPDYEFVPGFEELLGEGNSWKQFMLTLPALSIEN